VFQGRPDTVVELIPGTGHCAASKLPQAMATIAGWLSTPSRPPPPAWHFADLCGLARAGAAERPTAEMPARSVARFEV
jgi:hypothetical protein